MRAQGKAEAEEEHVPRTIVVIGAEKDYRSMARDIFSGQYEVAEFTDGEEALAFAEFHRRDIEVVLLNYASGTGRDAETLASFKSSDKTRNIPVIVVARSDADKEAQALEMGAEDFLTPPFAAPIPPSPTRACSPASPVPKVSPTSPG